VIGFNIIEGVVLDIQEINQTTSLRRLGQAQAGLPLLGTSSDRAVVDFGRSCQAKQIRLQPAHRYPAEAEVLADPAKVGRIAARTETAIRRQRHGVGI